MVDFRAARDVVRAAVSARVFPGAVVEVGTATRPVWQDAVGGLTYDVDTAPVRLDTVYDLASLTKVVATSSIAIRAVEHGAIGLDDTVRAYAPAWVAPDRAAVTLRDLLAHASGLPAWAPLFRTHQGAEAYKDAICSTPLDYPPRTRSVYSDLGFMLLGFILSGEHSLAARFDALWTSIGAGEDLQFLPPAAWRRRTAPTGMDEWRGRTLVGEVHDQNCFALGGVAGHAGLFGTASAVGTFARHLLQVLDGRGGAFARTTLATFVARRAEVPHSSRALGWDTMLPTSSCGGRMSARAFGHTGFTGTSLWIDPDAGCYVVLLSNRVHPTADGDGIGAVRAAFHDAAMEEVGRGL
ncbi:MAG TPA: serine hydrolase [Vicinamibacterales bacterium]